MWKKIKPVRPSPMPRRATPAVNRARTGDQAASLILPGDMVHADHATIYCDGNGKLAFAIGDRGEYKVKARGTSRTRCVTIPNTYADRIPYGTTDVSLSRDGDMLVLDLNQIGK